MNTLSETAKYALGLTAIMSVGQAAHAACAMFGGSASVVANELDQHAMSPSAPSAPSKWASPVRFGGQTEAQKATQRAANAARRAAKIGGAK